MSPKILVIGSTGKLGTILLNYCNKNSIRVNTITCFTNSQKLVRQKNSYKISNSFCLSIDNDKYEFINHIKKNKFNIIYFLDFGSESIEYVNLLINKNKNCHFAIANKELIISGGTILQNKIKKTSNYFIPLDSEHFSLTKSNLDKSLVDKIYITASGGPFYFKKNINLNNVNLSQVLSHPKWKMGINNSIDSSNFINKILEIYELSIIFNIDIKNIDFLISKEAYIHSIVVYKDGTINLNCFDNNMLITLSSPLRNYFNLKKFNISKKYLSTKSFNLEEFNDNRFKIIKHYSKFRALKHSQIIQFIILNNFAQKYYLSNKIKYHDICDFIFKNLSQNFINFKNLSEILVYIKQSKKNLIKNYE